MNALRDGLCDRGLANEVCLDGDGERTVAGAGKPVAAGGGGTAVLAYLRLLVACGETDRVAGCAGENRAVCCRTRSNDMCSQMAFRTPSVDNLPAATNFSTWFCDFSKRILLTPSSINSN